MFYLLAVMHVGLVWGSLSRQFSLPSQLEVLFSLPIMWTIMCLLGWKLIPCILFTIRARVKPGILNKYAQTLM